MRELYEWVLRRSHFVRHMILLPIRFAIIYVVTAAIIMMARTMIEMTMGQIVVLIVVATLWTVVVAMSDRRG